MATVRLLLFYIHKELKVNSVLLTLSPLDKMSSISQKTFSDVFSGIKIMYVNLNLTEVNYQGSIWQPIFWTNADSLHWGIRVPLGGDDL